MPFLPLSRSLTSRHVLRAMSALHTNPQQCPNLESQQVVTPEQAAQALLQINSPPSLAQVLDMCEHLPWESPSCGWDFPGAVHFTQAARTRVVFLGSVSPAWPSLGLLGSLTSLLRQAVPHLPFTSLAILDQVQSGPRRDLLNSFSPNVVIPLTSFEGGGIWIENQSGATQRVVQGKPLSGNVCDFSLGHGSGACPYVLPSDRAVVRSSGCSCRLLP